jgi:hypothetical protein
MKKIIFVLLSLFTTGSYAQELLPQVRKISGFTEIKNMSSLKITVIKAAADRVVITGDNKGFPFVETKVVGNELQITSKDKKMKGLIEPVSVIVEVSNLVELENAGSGLMTVEGTLKQEKIELENEGSGVIEITFEGSLINAEMAGSGVIKISGNAQKAKIENSGSGAIDAQKTYLTEAEINLKGSGIIKLNAKRKISGNIAGSGNCINYGKPQLQNIQISGSGKYTEE